MANIMQNIASIVWLILAVVVFFRLKQWDKMFSELYDELKKEIRGADNG